MKQSLKDRLELFKEKGYHLKGDDIITPKGRVINNTVVVYSEHGKKVAGVTFSILKEYLLTGEIVKTKTGPKTTITKDKLNARNKRVKERIERKTDVVDTKPKPEIKPKQTYYIDDTEMIYHIILSKGLGKITPKLQDMFILISTNLTYKFSYRFPEDRLDCINEGILQLYTNRTGFDEHKYKKALPYMTEICKRGQVRCFNTLRPRDIQTIPIDGTYY